MNESVEVLHPKQLSRLLEATRGVLASWQETGTRPGAELELQRALVALQYSYDDCRATMANWRAPDAPVVGYGRSDMPQGICRVELPCQRCSGCGRPL